MFCSQNLGGVLNVALSLRGVHVLLRIFRGGQGFTAFVRQFQVFLAPSLTPYALLVLL